MIDKIEAGIVEIKPVRVLPTGNEMNFPHPWSKLVNTTEPVLQETIVTETGVDDTVLLILLQSPVMIELLLPIGVVHVDPCDHYINIVHS